MLIMHFYFINNISDNVQFIDFVFFEFLIIVGVKEVNMD